MKRKRISVSTSSSLPLWGTIAIVLFGTIINPLDGSMTSQALPSMSSDLHADAGLTMWTMSMYYLGSMASQPVMGRISDMFGARRIFIVGLSVVSVCCACTLIAPNIQMVVALRLLQAIGSAVAFPTGLSIVRRACIGRGMSADHPIGTITWVNSLAASMGPVVGGVLVSHLGWRGPSLLTLVASLTAVVAGMAFLPHPVSPGRSGNNGGLSDIDFVGIACFVLAISGIQIALTGGYEVFITLQILLASGAAALGFTVRELHASHPFVDLRRLRKSPNILLVFFVYAAANFIFFSVLTGLPTWLQNAMGLTPFTSGLATAPISVLGVIITLLAGHVVYRQRQRLVMRYALGSMMIGSLCLGVFSPVATLPIIIIVGVMMASPNNISTLSLQTTLYTMIDPEETGLYTGLFQTSRYLGASLATTLTSMTVASSNPGIHQLRSMGFVCASAACIATVVMWLMRKDDTRRERQ